MNIFILDEDIKKSAQAHCDKHICKMILESAQLLCTAVNYYAGEQVTPYKSTHINHPCSLWVRESWTNFNYLTLLMIELEKEWQFRFNHTKWHKSVVELTKCNILALACTYFPSDGKSKGLTPFALCMPEEYKVSGNAVQSYRNYYNGEKQHLFKWTNRDKPEWVNSYEK